MGSNTQERIKRAARVVFHKKGFAASRTRDIAEEANINLALLNYYFRSKEKLFYLIMVETLTVFYQTMNEVFNHEATSLETKIQIIAENYIDLLILEPQVPVFIISELRNDNTEILEKIPAAKTILKSVFVKQYNEAVRNKIIIETNPVHFLMNLMGLIVFPFINNLAIKKIAKIDDRQFNKLMEERREKIPVWIKAMFAVT